MTGPEHYREAERLLAHAREPGVNPVPQAQVHATLALAAATAEFGWPFGWPIGPAWDRWREALS